MLLRDALNSFSIEDLREVALRRQVLLTPELEQNRQSLVRVIEAAVEQYPTAALSLYSLRQPELQLLSALLRVPGRPLQVRLASVAAELQIALQRLHPLLESLRLHALVFPVGDWAEVLVPPATRQCFDLVALSHRELREPQPLPLVPEPPAFERDPKAICSPRTGSLARDAAELLARASRATIRYTRTGSVHRTDLRSLSEALSLRDPEYVEFLVALLDALGAIRNRDCRMSVTPSALAWLERPEPIRSRLLALTWASAEHRFEAPYFDPFRGYRAWAPSTALGMLRRAVVEGLAALPEGGAVTLRSFLERLQWTVPLAFRRCSGQPRMPSEATRRLLAALFWMGLAAVDDPAAPQHVGATPLGLAMSDRGGPLLPEEREFVLQPNAEAFAPPNLAPATLFHLRRITGESAGGPANLYPITPASLRRALDTGLSGAEILRFLEGFSRTGLPEPVRRLVEAAARQHGRIRLVPAGYLLVADEPALLEELRRQAPIAEHLGREISERVVIVAEETAARLLRALRSRGYAPLDESETRRDLPLPSAPGASADTAAPDDAAAAGGPAKPGELDPAGPLLRDPRRLAAAVGTVTEPDEIARLLDLALQKQLEVEIEPKSGYPERRTLWAVARNGCSLYAYCATHCEWCTVPIGNIRAARFTGHASFHVV